MSFVLYLVVSVLARLVASSGDAGSKDIEILVLRLKGAQTLISPGQELNRGFCTLHAVYPVCTNCRSDGPNCINGMTASHLRNRSRNMTLGRLATN
jgi:hypothetical protein